MRGWRLGLAVALGFGLIGSTPLLVAYARDYAIEDIYSSLVALWVNAIVIGYVIGVPMYQGIEADVNRPLPLMDPEERARAGRDLRSAWSNAGVWVARLIGVGVGLLLSAGPLRSAIAGSDGSLLYLWVVLIPIVWAVIVPALWRLIRLSLFVFRLGRDRVRVDLGDLHSLDAFADIAIRTLLFIVVGLSMIPMQAILRGSLAPLDFVPALLVTVPVALIVVILPMWGIHRAMIAAKQMELERLTQLRDATNADSDRFLLLSLYLREIAQRRNGLYRRVRRRGCSSTR